MRDDLLALRTSAFQRRAQIAAPAMYSLHTAQSRLTRAHLSKDGTTLITPHPPGPPTQLTCVSLSSPHSTAHHGTSPSSSTTLSSSRSSHRHP
eukprot:1835885-Rhodomonas_salina.1